MILESRWLMEISLQIFIIQKKKALSEKKADYIGSMEGRGREKTVVRKLG